MSHLCSCPLRETALLIAGIFTAVFVLTLHWLVTVTLKSYEKSLHLLDQPKNSQLCSACLKRVYSVRKPRRADAKRKPRKRSYRRQISVRAKNILYQCDNCHLSQDRHEHFALKETTSTISQDAESDSRNEQNDKTRSENGISISNLFYELYHTVYTELVNGSGADQQQCIIKILVHSKHEEISREAERTLSQPNVKILVGKQLLSVRPSCAFSANLLCKDLTCDPPQIDFTIQSHHEKVLKCFAVHIHMKRLPVGKKYELPDQILVEYKAWSCGNPESRCFLFPLVAFPHSSVGKEPQTAQSVYNAFGENAIALQCNNYFHCPQHHPPNPECDTSSAVLCDLENPFPNSQNYPAVAETAKPQLT